jgi:hypothetical protein
MAAEMWALGHAFKWTSKQNIKVSSSLHIYCMNRFQIHQTLDQAGGGGVLLYTVYSKYSIVPAVNDPEP